MKYLIVFISIFTFCFSSFAALAQGLLLNLFVELSMAREEMKDGDLLARTIAICDKVDGQLGAWLMDYSRMVLSGKMKGSELTMMLSQLADNAIKNNVYLEELQGYP